MVPATPSPRVLIISPAKDEAEYIGVTIRSMVAQTCRPALWIIVNDGSTDDTGRLAEEAAREHSWIRVVHRQSGARKVGPGVVDAFYEGLSHARLEDFDYVCKLDVDLEFQAEYFERLLAKFAANPRLGTASGKCFLVVDGEPVSERTRDDFSHGTSKLYRRECFEQIGGFVREVMWDGIDCHRCRMLGWEATSFRDPELRVLHLRQMGSSYKSVYHGRLRWGRGQYFMGTHPVYLLGITAYRMLERPWILGGLCIFAGYTSAWFTRVPRYEDPQFRRYLHHWQLGRAAKWLSWVRVPPTTAAGAAIANSTAPNAAQQVASRQMAELPQASVPPAPAGLDAGPALQAGPATVSST